MFFKQVKISPEIDWYHYQSAKAAPMAIVRHRIKGQPPLVLGKYMFEYQVPSLVSNPLLLILEDPIYQIFAQY